MSSQAQRQLVGNLGRFPQTRYQGSKQKLLPWIWDHVKDLKFSTCLDAFGGTGCVAYMMKVRRKQTTYNDVRLSNAISAKVLIENKDVLLSPAEADALTRRQDAVSYPNFIGQTFKEIYVTPDEDDWIDTVRKNISPVDDRVQTGHRLSCALSSKYCEAQSAENSLPPIPAVDAERENPVKPTTDALAEARPSGIGNTFQPGLRQLNNPVRHRSKVPVSVRLGSQHMSRKDDEVRYFGG